MNRSRDDTEFSSGFKGVFSSGFRGGLDRNFGQLQGNGFRGLGFGLGFFGLGGFRGRFLDQFANTGNISFGAFVALNLLKGSRALKHERGTVIHN